MKVLSLLKLSKAGSKGSSLIEAMLAMIILAILVIGGMSFVIHSTGRINIYRDKIMALEIANNRFEELRAFGYARVSGASGIRYLQKQKKPGNPSNKDCDKAWVLNSTTGNLQTYLSDPAETVDISGLNEYVSTKVTGGADYHLVVVSVCYRQSTGEKIIVSTYIGRG
jgi:type II secretory pathway pseudopilin PulG